MPRPPKLTPQIQAQLETMLQNNTPVVTACEALGLHEATFYAWMAKGQAGKKPYREFYEAITRTRALGELSLIQSINKASEKDWRAAVFLLTIRRPETYRPPTKMEHSGANGTPIAPPQIQPPIINLLIEQPREKNVTPASAA